jgi:tellurite resistance protein TehA-like permease
MRNDLKFGLIGGGISIAWTLLMWVLGLHQGDLSLSTTLGYFTLIFPIAIVYFAIRETRNKELEGFISYGKGVGVGTIAGIVSTVISTLFSYIYTTVLNPAYQIAMKDFQITKAMESMQKKNMTQDQINQALQQMNNSPMVVFQYVGAIVGGIILYVIISLIIAAILQKKKIEEIKQV